MKNKDEVIKELTMMLMYLTKFDTTKRMGSEKDISYTGYSFDAINELWDKEYIRKLNNKSNKAFITEDGLEYAKRLLAEYEIYDYNKPVRNSIVGVVVAEFEDYDGYIDWRSASRFHDKVLDQIKSKIDDMIYESEYTEIFTFLLNQLGELEEVMIDDSNGEITSIGWYMYEWMIDVIPFLFDDTSNNAIDKLYEAIIDEERDKFDDVYEKLLLEGFVNDYNKSKLLKTIKKIIRIYNKSNEAYIREYYVERWIKNYILVQEKFGCNWMKDKQFINEFYNSYYVRTRIIDDYIEHKKYEDAIEMLLESKILNFSDSGVIENKLKFIYNEQGNHEKYLESLWELALHHDFDLEFYKELKMQYTKDEWIELREKFFTQSDRKLLEIFVEEEMWDKLIKYLKQRNLYSEIIAYQDALMKVNTPVLLGMLKNAILYPQYESFNTRKDYQRTAKRIKSLMKFNGGKEVAKEIIDYLMEKHSNRSAMKEELSLIKFD